MTDLDSRPLMAIQIDCDGELARANHYGAVPRARDEVYGALAVLLDLLARWQLVATLFVVGRDVEDGERCRLLSRAVAAGHEIANHTYSHPRSFLALAPRDREREIVLGDEAIRNHLGVRCRGFRAPNFEAADISPVLRRLGYRYDCSLLPTPYGGVLRLIKRLASGAGPAVAGYGSGAGEWRVDRRPALTGGVYRVPVTVSPWLRLPCHASFALALPRGPGRALTRWTVGWTAQRNLPLIYVFHLSDVAPASVLTGAERRLYRSLDQRLEFVEWLCRTWSATHRSVTTSGLVGFESGEE